MEDVLSPCSLRERSILLCTPVFLASYRRISLAATNANAIPLTTVLLHSYAVSSTALYLHPPESFRSLRSQRTKANTATLDKLTDIDRSPGTSLYSRSPPRPHLETSLSTPSLAQGWLGMHWMMDDFGRVRPTRGRGGGGEGGRR
jgi:hypothetical protein